MARSAIVTGASSGIGAETVRKLAEHQFNVVAAARRAERIESLCEEVEAAHGVSTLSVPTNVRSESTVEQLIDSALEEFGKLDVLVNNAGIVRGNEVTQCSTEDYRAMMETNVDGVFYTTRAALPALVETTGNLIFVGSFAGRYPRSFNPVYAATKWWVRGFAHSVAAQYGEQGLGVTVVNPSEVRTEITVDRSDEDESSEAFKEIYAPGEVTEPREVADAIVFAAEMEQSTVTELDLFRRDKLTDSF